jgi:ribonuclease P protein component
MISRLYRFSGHHSLKSVYQRGQTVRGSFLQLKYLPRQDQSRYRAAVVVSRKVHKSAVVRNRIRRRIYEILRQQQTKLLGLDVIVTVFSEQVAELEAAKLANSLTELIDKVSSRRP